MNVQNLKCVMVIDEALPLGVIANTAGILGITLGKHAPERVNVDVQDASGKTHLGIIDIPVPVLKGNAGLLKTLRERLYEPEYADLLVVDFSDTAQSCQKYEDYIEKAAGVEERDLQYFGIAICGEKKKVSRLTGNLPLLR
ncbi:DUF2000 domain-containing protein [Clostridium sp. D33t1_170424_F3]|uniref:DUF2000 domain-containing protein n=1 Tax=Clostridium sp. D33t1_170424_F3 TaxID=2787099 RepID=UPI0018A92029|nr:DUF2000 domain-containing protein [Clostridium sp. D33t1_170424_F3]